MGSLLIHNIGQILTGDLSSPLHSADRIYIGDGIVQSLGGGPESADVIIDAHKLTVTPGLIDGHTHPALGTFTPAQDCVDWIRNYLHGGVTSMVSAGELHVPGLPLSEPDPQLFKALAVLAKRTYDRLRPSGAKVHAGTLLMVPGLRERDFAELAAEGIRLVKFIFYDFAGAPAGEAQQYVAWAHKHGMAVKIHSGGVSRSGVSQMADANVLKAVQPDIAGHINGGPIPMRLDDMRRVVEETDCFLEIASSGNYRAALLLMEWVVARGEQHRVVLGTDTPGGTGVIPRGMLRNIALIASLGGVAPEHAFCMATGNVARAHRLEEGILREGGPADLLLMGPIKGSEGEDVLDGFRIGNIPGISVVITDGIVRVAPRTEQLPPPERQATVRQFRDTRP